MARIESIDGPWIESLTANNAAPRRYVHYLITVIESRKLAMTTNIFRVKLPHSHNTDGIDKRKTDDENRVYGVCTTSALHRQDS